MISYGIVSFLRFLMHNNCIQHYRVFVCTRWKSKWFFITCIRLLSMAKIDQQDVLNVYVCVLGNHNLYQRRTHTHTDSFSSWTLTWKWRKKKISTEFMILLIIFFMWLTLALPLPLPLFCYYYYYSVSLSFFFLSFVCKQVFESKNLSDYVPA